MALSGKSNEATTTASSVRDAGRSGTWGDVGPPHAATVRRTSTPRAVRRRMTLPPADVGRTRTISTRGHSAGPDPGVPLRAALGHPHDPHGAPAAALRRGPAPPPPHQRQRALLPVH